MITDIIVAGLYCIVHLYCMCACVLLKISVLDQFPTEMGTGKAQKKTFSCTEPNVAKKPRSFFHADFII